MRSYFSIGCQSDSSAVAFFLLDCFPLLDRRDDQSNNVQVDGRRAEVAEKRLDVKSNCAAGRSCMTWSPPWSSACSFPLFFIDVRSALSQLRNISHVSFVLILSSMPWDEDMPCMPNKCYLSCSQSLPSSQVRSFLPQLNLSRSRVIARGNGNRDWVWLKSYAHRYHPIVLRTILIVVGLFDCCSELPLLTSCSRLFALKSRASSSKSLSLSSILHFSIRFMVSNLKHMSQKIKSMCSDGVVL